LLAATDLSPSKKLRSSAAADGGRCSVPMRRQSPDNAVAILGRRGRRPLLAGVHMGNARKIALRSSAAADGGRCH